MAESRNKQNVTRRKDYCDLDLNFTAHPTTKDVAKLKGVNAIRRSVRNLVLSNFYERPFRSYIGSNAQKLLFDNINPLTANFLKNAIKEVVENFEPRVRFIDPGAGDIIVRVSPDRNGYHVTINFVVINSEEPASVSFFLERIR